MQIDPALTGIIDNIYEGSLEADRWQSALRGFLDMTNGHAAFLAIVDNRQQNLLASTVVGPEESAMGDALDLYRDELVEIDPGFNIVRGDGGRFRFSDTSDEVTSDPSAWREFIQQDFGSGDYHSLISPTGGSLSVSIALHTHRAQTAITPEQQRIHETVFSHLSRAARLLIRRPNFAQREDALILVDENAHILDATGSAEKILSAGDGMTVCQGRLRLTEERRQSVLQQHARRACNPQTASSASSWITVRRNDEDSPWLVHFEPIPLLPLETEQKVYGCIIRLSGGGKVAGLDEDMVASIFGLTPREAQVALRLAQATGDLKAIAADLGMGYETARSHSRAAMAKMGVGNRIELIRQLAQYR